MPASRGKYFSIITGAALATTGAVSATTVSASHAVTSAVIARMTASATPVTDQQGAIWAARSGTLGTSALSTRLVGQDISGTSDDQLYQKNAWGVTDYSTAVPTPGTYHVRLLTAEDSFSSAGQRVFDVSAEGLLKAKDVDIAKAVGRAAAYDVGFNVFVADGKLDLAFAKKVDLPLVSAIEVTRTEGLAQPGAPFDLRMSSLSGVQNYKGYTWYPGFGWAGPAKRSASLENEPIGSTKDDALYRVQTWGMTSWRAEVPEPGAYTVQLFTAEGKYTEVGQRVFDITAEGRTIVSNVDVYRAVGVRTAYSPKFDVNVTDGVLDLGFVNKKDFASIASIRVTRATDQSPVVEPSPDDEPNPTGPTPPPTTNPAPRSVFSSRMVARSTPVTDSDGRVWGRWSTSLGSWRVSKRLAGKNVAGTDEPELFRSNVWGARGYSLPVSEDAATYKVRLLLAEDSFPSAGQRVFDVKAEGKLVASQVDVAGAVGINHAYEVAFSAEVSDGMLSLDFVRRIDQPMVSAIEVTSVTPVTPPSDRPRRIMPVGPDSFWTQKVTNAAVAANSAATSAALTNDVVTRFGGMAGFNAYQYAVGYHAVPKGTPRVTVDRSCGTTWSPNIYDGAGYFLDVPVPSRAVAAVGSDAHMELYDAETDKSWSFWQMRRSSTTGRWSACWGGRIDNISKSQGIYPAGYGAAASGLAMPPGMITQDEVRRGRIDHAVAIAVPNAMKESFSWPANRTDGVSSSPDAVMQGQRLRLDPALDLDQYELTPIGRMIAKAAQEYGFVPIDTAGAVAVLAQAGDAEEAETGTNPWQALVGDRQWEVMSNFPWNKMQVLTKDCGRP